MYVSLDGAAKLLSLLSVLLGLLTVFVGAVKRRAREQNALKTLREAQELEKKHTMTVRKSCREEQTLMIYGLLACLKGLKEQGCNGPVTEAIDKIEKHINNKAHEDN